MTIEEIYHTTAQQIQYAAKLYKQRKIDEAGLKDHILSSLEWHSNALKKEDQSATPEANSVPPCGCGECEYCTSRT